jgi:hypothetical protein
MNDPVCLFLGNYDRCSELTGKWTQVLHNEEDKGDYLEVIFDRSNIPTIGANGFLIRKQALEKFMNSDYIFDIDVVYQLVNSDSKTKVAKVKLGIIHLFSNSVRKFSQKQKRRIRDFIYYSKAGARIYPWKSINRLKLLLFVLCTVTLVPLLFQSIKGYVRKPDTAWFFHPLACLITLWVYGWSVLRSLFLISKFERKNWRQ